MTIDYKQELKAIEREMIAAASFAEKLPIFADVIMRDKLNGTEEYRVYTTRYKDIPLVWGVIRSFHATCGSRTIINRYLFSIHVNTISLYDLNDDFGLYEALKDVDIFFADTSKSTFYVTDENIESFLEALNSWYLVASKKAKKVYLQNELKRAQKDVEKYTKLLEEMNNNNA